MVKLLIFGWKEENLPWKVLSPLEICGKIGIFSMLLLSLFADRENIQIFLALRERLWFILLSI